MDFTEEQVYRYSRHILLQDIGVEGQEKICNGKVLIVGVGGLGSPIAYYLAAAGVGTIGIIDPDVVEISNLQRQIIHFADDVEKSKVLSAKEKMQKLNPEVKVVTYQTSFGVDNALEIVRDYDFIVDGTDNFSAKYLINDACVMAGKPFSHGGILRFQGQTLTHVPGSACYRCLYPEPPGADAVPSCSQAGVLGAVAGVLGSIQAVEVLKFITGVGTLLTNRLLTFDAREMDFKTLLLKQDTHCPVCGINPSITMLQPVEEISCKI